MKKLFGFAIALSGVTGRRDVLNREHAHVVEEMLVRFDRFRVFNDFVDHLHDFTRRSAKRLQHSAACSE
jgi:hypothetical protein